MPFFKGRITPSRIIILGFLGLIAVGTGLLMLPWATQSGVGASLGDALFTAVSATCVTGLVVQDTALYWSGFGQVVILLLIQIGGMGIVTMAVAIVMFSGQRIGLKQRWVMQESISAPQVGGIIRQTRFIVMTSLAIEGIGALLLALRFSSSLGFPKGVWYGVFHSVSAFCNAGFDLMGTEFGACSSMTGYTGDVVVNLVLIALIVIGGLGFMTWCDLKEHRGSVKRCRLQTKLVLWTSVILLGLGFVFFLCYEFRRSAWNGMGMGEKVTAALFQAVTPRTAGFNTVDLAAMSEASQLLIIGLMLVGGSPGSTAGGFKTTTLAVLIVTMRSVFIRRGSTVCFGRRIPDEVTRNAAALLVLYLGAFLVGGTAIAMIEEIPLMAALFEAASAVATVGLSLGFTAKLGTVSRVILMLLMYLGRVGGLTLIYALTRRTAGQVQFPQEQVTVG